MNPCLPTDRPSCRTARYSICGHVRRVTRRPSCGFARRAGEWAGCLFTCPPVRGAFALFSLLLSLRSRLFICLLAGVLFGGCSESCTSDTEKELAYALKQARKNRAELEKVLRHYQTEPQKRKAAKFLIRNLPYYFSYEGWQLDTIKQIIADKIVTKEVSPENQRRWGGFSLTSLSRKPDVQTVTADYLIQNIDFAFEVWEKRPWSRHYTFDDFCEYILPYRIGYEPLESWRKTYYDRYGFLLDSVYTGSDVVEACNQVTRQLSKEGFYDNEKSELPFPNLGASFFLNNRVGTCKESCDFTLYVMRALGIPVATDQLYYLPGLRSIHYWNVVKDTTGQVVPFWFAEDDVRRGNDDKRKKRKVYRRCFAVQPELIPGVSTDEAVVPTFKNRFLRDETEAYFGANRIVVRLKQPSPQQWVYLAGFAPVGWFPVTLAPANDPIVFRNVEPNLIYQLLVATPNGWQPLETPFYFDGKSIRHFRADTTRQVRACLTRKCALSTRVLKHLHHIVGGRFEASDTPGFERAERLYEVTSCPYKMYNTVGLDTHKSYRYVRYTAASDHTAELAELQFNVDSLFRPGISYVPSHYDSLAFVDLHRSFALVHDEDPLSYIESLATGASVAFDFGRPVPLHNLMYIPRNDDNFIRIGDTYELVYQNDRGEWVSLGRQTAAKDTLYYDVPPGALLWLKNHTRGEAEEVFEYTKEGAHFL